MDSKSKKYENVAVMVTRSYAEKISKFRKGKSLSRTRLIELALDEYLKSKK